MNYPKEPWKALHPKDGFDNGLIDADGMHISLRGDAMDRIVACVNACAGSSTAWLRGYGDMLSAADCAKPFQQNIRDLAAQRDELLAALKIAEPLVESLVDVNGYRTHKERAALVKIRSAIAKCEAQS